MAPITVPLFIPPPVSGSNCGYFANYFVDIVYHGNWHSPFGGKSFQDWLQNTLPSLQYTQPSIYGGATGVVFNLRQILKFPSGTGFDYTPYEYDIIYIASFEKAWWNDTPNTYYGVKVYPAHVGGSGFSSAFITNSEDAFITVSYRVKYYGPGGPGYPYPLSCPPLDFFGLPAKPKIYLGTAAPPPPPPKKKMDCCDCNTIATIVESQIMGQSRLFENLKDHIDQRIKEEIVAHGKQLEALEVDLQPVIDRINESESNLWNGIKR